MEKSTKEAMEILREKVLDINIQHLQQHGGEISRCPDDFCQLACLADNLIFKLDGETELAGFSIVGEQMKNIPMGTLSANRYDTDTEHVLHVWANEQSYDIRIPKKEFLGVVAVEQSVYSDECPYCQYGLIVRPDKQIIDCIACAGTGIRR